jgi:hypothetical protein
MAGELFSMPIYLGCGGSYCELLYPILTMIQYSVELFQVLYEAFSVVAQKGKNLTENASFLHELMIFYVSTNIINFIIQSTPEAVKI